jgi:hypothetical protein
MENQKEIKPTATQVNIVLNWFEELNTLVPVDN